MSFKENTYQQMSFTDSFSGLTAREQKALEKSWAKVFADEIFPAIDEKRFSVLYSDKASRPNTPVNVIVGALIIKELFDYSDDEMVENLMLDFRIQYLDYTDEDGVSNRDRMARGLAPLDSKTGKPIELHHLGQKADSPLVELTEEEHRTGEYEDGKKNQSLWHDNTVETEVHGEGNNWDQERKAHWKARAAQA